MPVYESEELPREELEKLRKRARCKVCGGWLNMFLGEGGVAFIACNDWLRSHHEGIEREASQYEQKGLESLNIPTRREIMNKELGEKSKALTKYIGLTTLTKDDAKQIVNTLWPLAEKASPEEVFKAIAICVQYGLNPLMRHLFLIPYWNSEKKRYDYSCILGITSNRLIASRKHHWSFLDDTPRIGTEEEEIKHYGKVNADRLRAIAKIKDIETGAEVTAWGEWPIFKLDRDGKKVSNQPKGLDKGNSTENMACIHAERKGLDMLYPADMPSSEIPVLDEAFIEGEYKLVEEKEAEAEPAQGEKGAPEKIQADAEDPLAELDPDPETEPETPPAKDESPITPQQLNDLDAMMNKTCTNLTSLGKFMNKDKGWNVKKLGDLKCWQFNEIMAAYEKGQEQPPAEKLL